MRELALDDDVFYYVLGRSGALNQTPSVLLREVFQLSRRPPAAAEKAVHTPTAVTQESGTSQRTRKFAEFLESAKFLVHGNVLGKFLAILGWLAAEFEQKFDSILGHSGRKRIYVGRSAKELDDSGRSVMPKKIPGTNFWVVTNNSTEMKRRMLEEFMRTLGCDRPITQMAIDALH